MTTTLSRRPGGRRWTTGLATNRRRETLAAYLFLLPQLIGLVVFVGGPLLVSLYYTFTKWDLIAPSPTWIGLDNWRYFFTDDRVWHVLGNTVKFILSGTTSFLLLSLLMALLLSGRRAGLTTFRVLFFLPWVLSQVAVGVTWTWMFNTRSGPVARVLDQFGVDTPNLLLEPAWAMYAIALVTTWQGIGFGMTIYLAGLQGIPQDLYDAARVDGASAWQRFTSITFPLLSPTTFFLMVTSFIGAFQLYDAVVVMTGSATGTAPGGPNDSTRTIVLYLYNQMFQYSERLSGIGYAATIAWMLAVLIFLVTLLQWRISRSWVFYSGED